MLANPVTSEKPTILCLPRELRDIIIEYCFLQRDPLSIELPNYPTSAPKQRLEGTNYASQERLLPHYPLLMVNRQFRAEGWEVLSRLAASNYQVDILLYHSQRLVLFMPTPKIPTRFKHIHAKLYVVKDDATRLHHWWHNRYRTGDGGATSDCWDLYAILQRFLQCGPPNAADAPADAHILIETLELDVRSETGIPENLLGPPNIPGEDKFEWPWPHILSRKLWYLRKETGLDYKMHPDYLAALRGEILRRILFYYAKGRMIYERVGVIRLLLDGRRLHEWNLDERLKEMRSQGDEHDQWRSSMLAHRSQMGFRHLITRHEKAWSET